MALAVTPHRGGNALNPANGVFEGTAAAAGAVPRRMGMTERKKVRMSGVLEPAS